MIRPILLTGASGFVGSHVLAELHRTGVGGRVHLMLRKHPTNESVIGLRFRDNGLQISDLRPRTHLVDLQDESAFLACLAELSNISNEWVVIHLAAVINSQGDLRAQEAVNFTRTQQLLDWTNRYGKRFVFTSSVVAFGATPTPIVRNEGDYPNYHSLNKIDGYSTTKRKAHDALLATAKVGTAILCPGIIHGSYEHMKSSRGHLQKVLDGKMNWFPGGGGAFVSLDHVGREIISAAINEGYDDKIHVKLLADVCLPHIEYLQIYRETAGLARMTVHRIPCFFVWPIAFIVMFFKLFGINIAILAKLTQALMYYYFVCEESVEAGTAQLKRALKLSHEKRG